jgi:hypothetical protein
MIEHRGVGSIKRLGGGALASRGTFGYWKGTKKIFPGNVKKNFPVIPYRNCAFFDHFFFLTWKFPNKKGTFEVGFSIYSDISLHRKGTFHHKKRALLVL